MILLKMNMKKENIKREKTAQEVQDEIFRKMSADRRLQVGFILMEAGLKMRKIGLKDTEIGIILNGLRD